MDYNSTTIVMGILINVVLTGAYYMAPMLIYRFLIYKNRLPKKLAIKVCIASGVVMYLILIGIYMATGAEGVPNMKAAFLYTWIIYFIVRDKTTL